MPDPSDDVLALLKEIRHGVQQQGQALGRLRPAASAVLDCARSPFEQRCASGAPTPARGREHLRVATPRGARAALTAGSWP